MKGKKQKIVSDTAKSSSYIIGRGWTVVKFSKLIMGSGSTAAHLVLK